VNGSAEALGTDRSFVYAGDNVYRGNRVGEKSSEAKSVFKRVCKVNSVRGRTASDIAKRQLKDWDQIPGTQKTKPPDQKVGKIPEVK
jgi:hypothetical protein